MNRFGDPFQIGRETGGDGEGDDLGQFVRVQSLDGGGEIFKAGAGGFYGEDAFRGGFDFALPAIDAADRGGDVDAGGKILGHE
jgi:hypothetical protein